MCTTSWFLQTFTILYFFVNVAMHGHRVFYGFHLCCGCGCAFWCGFGSGYANPCLRIMDPDPEPANFVIDLQDPNKNFLLITLWRYIYIIFQRQKVIKKSQNSRNQGFSYYFCLMIEGSGSGAESRWPKNIRFRRIRFLIRFPQHWFSYFPCALFYKYFCIYYHVKNILHRRRTPALTRTPHWWKATRRRRRVPALSEKRRPPLTGRRGSGIFNQCGPSTTTFATRPPTWRPQGRHWSPGCTLGRR